MSQLEVTLFVKPGSGWGLHILPNGLGWSDPDRITLTGFANAFDAWAFCFANFMIDPCPEGDRQWQNKPDRIAPKQIRMEI